jgi:hypothetical protein
VPRPAPARHHRPQDSPPRCSTRPGGFGGALGLAIFSAIATARTTHLLAGHTAPPVTLDAGFHQALIAAAIFLLAAMLFALRTTSARGGPGPVVRAAPSAGEQQAASDLTNCSSEASSR